MDDLELSLSSGEAVKLRIVPVVDGWTRLDEGSMVAKFQVVGEDGEVVLDILLDPINTHSLSLTLVDICRAARKLPMPSELREVLSSGP